MERTHVIKKTEYTSNIWFQVDNSINESCFERLFTMFDQCEFTNVPHLTVKEFVSKLQEWECCNSNRKHHPSCINYGATLELMLPKEASNDVLQQLCNRFIDENFEGYPYYAAVYKRGSASCIFFWIFERQYYENKKIECVYYTKDVYSNVKTGRICRKNDENAVLRHKKNEIKREKMTEFSLVKARFFSFTKKKFKQFRESIVEHVASYFVDMMSTKVVQEVTLPKRSLSSVQSRSGLINAIRIINPKIIEMEAEVNEIYQAMIDCDMLDELKKEFNKEIIQRIKNILHVKAFHHGNMKKYLQIHAGMKGDALEANMETLLDYVKELKTGFFKRYFMMKAEI